MNTLDVNAYESMFRFFDKNGFGKIPQGNIIAKMSMTHLEIAQDFMNKNNITFEDMQKASGIKKTTLAELLKEYENYGQPNIKKMRAGKWNKGNNKTNFFAGIITC